MKIIGLFVFAFAWSTAFASPELVPTQEMALGQSLAGGDTLNDSLYSNPAGSSFTSIYSIEGTYFAGKGFAASVLDSKTSNLGGGLGYYRMPDGAGVTNQGIKLSLFSKVAPNIAVGVAGKVLWGANLAGEKRNLKDLDLGALAHYPGIQFGGFVRNLLGGQSDYLDQKRELVLGGRINYEKVLYLSLAAHTELDVFQPYQLGVGVEYLSPYNFSLRGGFRTQFATGQSYWSLGAGVASGKFGIHYATQIPTRDDESMEHALSMNFML